MTSQSVPIIDGPDGTCAEFSHQPGKVTNWWVYELKDPKRGSYVFTADLSFQQGDKGFYAVLNRCKLAPQPPAFDFRCPKLQEAIDAAIREEKASTLQ